MCAIVDANVAHEVFGLTQSPAGEKFYTWINAAGGRLVIGGKLLKELEASSPNFKEWASMLGQAGRMRIVNEDQVNAKENAIKNGCVSNDSHIIALAQVSGARLLYSNDRDLQKDFKNKNLINQPRGKVYSTNKSENFTPAHQKLLGQRNLCQS